MTDRVVKPKITPHPWSPGILFYQPSTGWWSMWKGDEKWHQSYAHARDYLMERKAADESQRHSR